MNEIGGDWLIIIRDQQDRLDKAQSKVKEERAKYYKLIRRLAKNDIPQKAIGYCCGISRQRINQIIHTKGK